MTDSQKYNLQALYAERFSQLRGGVHVDEHDYTLMGRNTLTEKWADRYNQEMESSNLLYPFSGMVTNVGAGYCAGLVGGALAGSYAGLQHELKTSSRLTWGGAWKGFLNQGTTTSTLYANRLGAAAFAVGIVESALRYAIISRAQERYQFKQYDEDDVWWFEKDSRRIAPLSAFVVMPLLRFRRHRSTVISSTVWLLF